MAQEPADLKPCKPSLQRETPGALRLAYLHYEPIPDCVHSSFVTKDGNPSNRTNPISKKVSQWESAFATRKSVFGPYPPPMGATEKY